MTIPVRVAVCADYPEEGWPSMDRVASRLVAALRTQKTGAVIASWVCPTFKRRAVKIWPGRTPKNVDRGLNRLIDYPRHVARLAPAYDVFHVVDHSYAQLVHALPADRTVVTCHDLDAFRSVLQPADEPRSMAFRFMARHILAGLRRAACVTCDTAAVREELLARGLVEPDRVIVAPIGVGDEFTIRPDREADREVARLVGTARGALEIVHVGSTAPRKRLDLVLRSFAAIRRRLSHAHLVRVGEPMGVEYERLAIALGLSDHLTTLTAVSDRTLAAIYRRAAVVVLPSDREGFGLPVVEALKCGAPVVARDLPVLREVGGDAALYCASAEPEAWARAIVTVIRDRSALVPEQIARRHEGIRWASRFTWAGFADRLTTLYTEIARRNLAPTASEACSA